MTRTPFSEGSQLLVKFVRNVAFLKAVSNDYVHTILAASLIPKPTGTDCSNVFLCVALDVFGMQNRLKFRCIHEVGGMVEQCRSRASESFPCFEPIISAHAGPRNPLRPTPNFGKQNADRRTYSVCGCACKHQPFGE